MEPSAPLTLRRVLLGVLVGLLLVTLAFYGWVQYRQSQYNHRAHALVARYHQSYRLCVTAGYYPAGCASRAAEACAHDPFWSVGKPFAFAASDGSGRCQRVPLAGDG